MENAIQRRYWLALNAKAPPAPPRWAVIVVKCCVIGILLLPVSTFAWVFLYSPTVESDLGPIAFAVSVGLGLAMISCASILTSAYPPVPRER